MFVKDDHSFTRGVGAVAAMDAASPNRRIAAARAAVNMARRDAIMALGATRGTRTYGTATPPPVRKSTSTSTIETGQESAFSQPAPAPSSKKIKLSQRPKGLLVRGVSLDPSMRPGLVKLPGSVISPPETGTSTPSQSATPTAAPRATVSIVAGGGSGTSWTAPRAQVQVAPLDLPPAVMVPDGDAPAAVTAPKSQTSKYLLLAALGIGAWWLLARKK